MSIVGPMPTLNWVSAEQRRFWQGIHLIDPNPTGRKPVLLLHGLGATCESWGYQLPALVGAGLRPLAVDLPGFGQSGLPERTRWSIDLAAGEMARLLQALDSGPAHVVGLSLGGVVAQALACYAPALIDRLVLVNTFACLRPRKAGEWGYLLRRFLIANLRGHQAQAEAVARRIFPGPQQAELRTLLVSTIRATDPAVYRAAMRGLALFDSRARLKMLSLPVLVISGSDDTTVGQPVQADLARLISNSRRVVISAAGHAAPVDQPERFNQVLLEFLVQT